MARRNYSLVHWYPDLEKHKCGYCKQTNSNCSYGMWAQILTVEDYQFLIDRGWRRSGKYCYKPVMDVTCCPLYTIRCESLNFKASKSQKKIIKRVNRYLSDSFEDKSNESVLEMESDDAISNNVMHEKPNRSFDLSQIETEQLNSCVNSALVASKSCENILKCEIDKPIKMSTSTSSLITKDCKAGKGVDPTKPPCKKAKLLRLERKQQKLAAKGINTIVQNSVKSQGKTLEEFINDVSESPAHRLKVCLVRTGGSTDLPRIRAEEYPIYRKYQMTIHGDAPEKCTEKQFNSFLCDSPLQIVLKQMNPNEPSFKDSAKLFAKYQMFVHGESEDECDFSSFENFLVDTPLEHCEDSTLESGFGSFHQQYWLDDKLIAVGVIDILPKCISSVYFFYDPEYRHLTLGTYGSLRELFYVRQLQNIVPNLKYYYMGYYIHTCPKMRYKANLSPSFLLCPETYNWFAIENCIPKLDKQKYSRFNEDLDAVDKDGCTMNDIDELMILISYKGCVPFKFYKEKVKGQEDDFYTFGNLIGKTCIPRIIISSRHADF